MSWSEQISYPASRNSVSIWRLELSQCHSKPPNVVEPIPSQKSLQPTSSLSTPSLLQSHCPLPFASETYQSFLCSKFYDGSILWNDFKAKDLSKAKLRRLTVIVEGLICGFHCCLPSSTSPGLWIITKNNHRFSSCHPLTITWKANICYRCSFTEQILNQWTIVRKSHAKTNHNMV